MPVNQNDTQTQRKGYPLPKGDNYLSEDVERLRETIGKVDDDQHATDEAIRKAKIRRVLDVFPV